jgi:hypothetical protein
MAHEAVGQAAIGRNLVFFHQLLPFGQRERIDIPLHIEHLFTRANVVFRSAMTTETPSHIQWLGFGR